MNVSKYSIQNNRKYQEDRSIIKPISSGEALFGVFDGHGGSEVSELAVQNVSIIFDEIDDETKNDPEKTLITVVERLVELTNTYSAGSTLAIVWVKNNTAHVVVLGDSIVLIKNSEGKLWKSPEHNIRSNKKEAYAAASRGGVFDIEGKFVFDGNDLRPKKSGLQLSRALGNNYLHNVLNRNPEYSKVALNDNSWILLCSDGLIDPSHANTDSIDLVSELIEYGFGAQQIITTVQQIQQDDNSTAILIKM